MHACVGLPLFSDQALIGALTIDGMNPAQFDGISDEELRLVGPWPPPPSTTPCCWSGSPARAASPLVPGTRPGPEQPEMIGHSPPWPGCATR